MVLTEWRHTGVEGESAKVIENFPVRLFLQRRAYDCDAWRRFIFHTVVNQKCSVCLYPSIKRWAGGSFAFN